MFELSVEDREKLQYLIESDEFQLAASIILLYTTEIEVSQPTVNMINKFFICDHYFEAFAYNDNSYDDFVTRYVMCTKCKVLLAFHFSREEVMKKSIIIDDKIYVDF